MTQRSKLKQHKESIHEDVRYSCDICDHSAKQRSDLKQREESVHEGVRYSCNICNYNATHYSQKHKESVHVGVKYSCDICEYEAYFLVILNDTKSLFAKV